jgi:GAF domain-containing protein
MYDPRIVDRFIATYCTVTIPETDTPERLQVLEQISRPKDRESGTVADGANGPADSVQPQASDDLLAFVSLARLASGDVALADILSLATNLVRKVVPTATGVWFLKSDGADRLVGTDPFGPGRDSVRGMSIRVGDKLTGWVAANRQVMVNADAALDLGERALRTTPALVCCLSVPLTSGTTLLGVLTLYASDREAFGDDGGRVVQMVAPQIAQAIAAASQAGSGRATGAPDLKLVSSR